MNSKKQIDKTIQNIEKRFRKVENKPFQVIYDHESSSYIIRTNDKIVYPVLYGSFLEGLNLWISTILINDQGFLNIVLKEGKI